MSADVDAVIRKENQDLLVKIDAEADANIPKVAAAWSAGLGALLTAVGATALLGGGVVVSALDNPFRTVAIAAAVLGGGSLVGALVMLLRVSAGTLVNLRAEGFSAKKPVRAYLDSLRATNVERIERGRRLGLFAVTLILVGTLAVFIGYRPGVRLSVETADGTACGIVTTSDEQVIVLEVAGDSDPVRIAFDDIVTLTPVAAC